jgi:hypothetical protein
MQYAKVERRGPRICVVKDRTQQVRLPLELAEDVVIEHRDRPGGIIGWHDESARTERCVLDHAGAEIGAPDSPLSNRRTHKRTDALTELGQV